LIVGLLWSAAVAAGTWVIGPAIGFLVYPRKFEVDVDEDPRAAEAHGDDPAYDAKLRELAALGFVPVGKVVEHARFFTPLHWHWRADGAGILVSPDRTTFAHLYRLAGTNPLRVTLATTFKGGGVLETASPGVGLDIDNGDDRHIEVADTDAAGIVELHQRHARSFSDARSLSVEPMALPEMAARTIAFAQRNFGRSQVAGWYLRFAVCVGMAFPLLHDIGLPAAPAWARPVVLCLGALVFAAFRWAVLPGRRYRVLPVGVGLAAMFLPTFLFWGVPSMMTAQGREVAGLLDRIEADGSAYRPLQGVDRIVAHGAGVCGAVVKRFVTSFRPSPERRALYEVLVALKGSDLGDDPDAWRSWCLSERFGGR
jgi:hypothetical protein